jgi:hypothetical protein
MFLVKGETYSFEEWVFVVKGTGGLTTNEYGKNSKKRFRREMFSYNGTRDSKRKYFF